MTRDGLSRISHHLTAKAGDRCATTSLRSIVVLDGLSSTPPRADRRPPRIDAPLTHYRSPRGKKCGLHRRAAMLAQIRRHQLSIVESFR